MNQGYERIGRVSTDSVFKHTRRHWKDWIPLLDKAGARTWTHQEIVKYLAVKHKLSLWWQQGVAYGYEIAVGKRVEGQNVKGKYTVTATKSIPLSISKLWNFLLSDEGMKIWLKPLSPVRFVPNSMFETDDGFFGEVRTMKKNSRIRITWQDPNWEKKTVVQISLIPRPNHKSLLVVDHADIVSSKIKTQLGLRWRLVVTELQKHLSD